MNKELREVIDKLGEDLSHDYKVEFNLDISPDLLSNAIIEALTNPHPLELAGNAKQEAIGFAEWLDEKVRTGIILRQNHQTEKWLLNKQDGDTLLVAYTTEQLYQLYKHKS